MHPTLGPTVFALGAKFNLSPSAVSTPFNEFMVRNVYHIVKY